MESAYTTVRKIQNSLYNIRQDACPQAFHPKHYKFISLFVMVKGTAAGNAHRGQKGQGGTASKRGRKSSKQTQGHSELEVPPTGSLAEGHGKEVEGVASEEFDIK
jgi:hypothetical protein